MIKLTELDSETTHFVDLDSMAPEERPKCPTFRRLLKNLMGGTKAKSGEESLDMIQIGLKLKLEGDIEVDNNEFRILKTKAEANTLEWNANWQGQVLLYLKKMETESEKEEKEK